MSKTVNNQTTKSSSKRKIAPLRTPEARESLLINLAMNQAQKQLEEGTASSQVLTFFLKLGASIAQYEKAKLEAEVELAKAKVEAIRSQQTSEELYKKALSAFRMYNGEDSDYEDEEDEDEVL